MHSHFSHSHWICSKFADSHFICTHNPDCSYYANCGQPSIKLVYCIEMEVVPSYWKLYVNDDKNVTYHKKSKGHGYFAEAQKHGSPNGYSAEEKSAEVDCGSTGKLREWIMRKLVFNRLTDSVEIDPESIMSNVLLSGIIADPLWIP